MILPELFRKIGSKMVRRTPAEIPDHTADMAAQARQRFETRIRIQHAQARLRAMHRG